MHPQLANPTIFITSSFDVSAERDIAIAKARDVASRHPNRPVVYDWRDERRFTAGRSFQEQIPSLQAPNCWVTICIFGERIGELKDRCFEEMQTKERWPDSLTNLPLTLDFGDRTRTPLTGSVYEYLEASQGEKKGTGRVLVYFKGPQTVLQRRLDPRKRGFGNRELMAAIGRRHDPANHQFALAPQAEQEEYWRQIDALARFHDTFLVNRDCRTFTTPEAFAAQIERDLKQVLDFGAPSERQLFKALASFGSRDHPALFGRDDEVAGIVKVLEQAEKTPDGRTLLILKGKSGSGKSSLAKAGVAGKLMAQARKGGWRYCAVDATTCQLEASRRRWAPLAVLGHRIALAARPPSGRNAGAIRDLSAGVRTELSFLHRALVKEIAAHAETWRPDTLAERLLRHFDDEQRITGKRLVPVIVLDQFEPKLDKFSAGHEYEKSWRPVVKLLDRLASARRAWVLVPLPYQAKQTGQTSDFADAFSERLKELEAHPRRAPALYDIALPRAELIRDIIAQPFLDVGEPLSEDIINPLLEEIEELRKKGDDAILPLIGLVLDWINRKRKERHIQAGRGDQASGAQPGIPFRPMAGQEDDLGQLGERLNADRKVSPLTFTDLGRPITLAQAMSYQGEAALTAFESRLGWLPDAERPMTRVQTNKLLYQLLDELAEEQLETDDEQAGIHVGFELTSCGFSSMSPEVQALARCLMDARLLTLVSTKSVRLVHEYVLRNWEPATAWRNAREQHELTRAPLNEMLDQKWKPGSPLALEPEWLAKIEDWLAHARPSDKGRKFFIRALVEHFHGLTGRDELVERLEAAIAIGSEDLCSRYIDHARDANGILRLDPNTRSAGALRLPLTVQAGQAQLGAIAQRLISEGASAARGDARGRSVVHALAETGQDKTLAAILKAIRPEDIRSVVNAKTQILGWSALHAAAKNYSAAPATIAVLKTYGGNILAETASKRVPLHFAALAGSKEAASALLAEHADRQLCARDKSGQTPLLTAVEAQRAAIVECICVAIEDLPRTEATKLAKGANVREALRMATESGNAALVRPLARCFRHLDWRQGADKDGQTPLQHAAEHGYLEIARLLLTAGPQLDAVNAHGETALILAVRNGHKDVVRLLVEEGADTAVRSTVPNLPATRVTALHHAVYFNHQAIVDILLSARPGDAALTDERRFTPLHLAALIGNPDLASRLLEHSPPNAQTDKGRTPLHLAARNGHADVIKVLLTQPGINLAALNIYGQTSLHLAAYHGHKEAVLELAAQMTQEEILLPDYGIVDEANENPAETGGAAGGTPSRRAPMTALEAAIRQRHIEAVLALLDVLGAGPAPGDGSAPAQAAPDIAGVRDADGRSLLHIAARLGMAVLAKRFLDSCPDMVHTTDENGCTPLFMAIRGWGRWEDQAGQLRNASVLEMVDLLLSHGAKIDVADQEGATPLHLAASRRATPILRRLLQELRSTGGDAAGEINRRGSIGARTPIFIAAQCGCRESVKELLAWGADPSIVSEERRTALHAAAINGEVLIVEAILDHNNGEWVSLLLEADPLSRDVYSKTPLHYAAEGSDAAMIRRMIAAGADLTARNRDDNGTPLHAAAVRGNAEAVRELLGARPGGAIDPDLPQADGSTALTLAAFKGHFDVVQVLLAGGAGVDTPGRSGHTALLTLVKGAEHAALVKAAEYASDPSLREREAKARGQITRLLLAHGADPSVKFNGGTSAGWKGAAPIDDGNQIGDTAAHLAIRFGAVEIAEAVIEHESCATLFGPRQASLLHYAAKFAHPSLVKRLVAKGFDPNQEDADKRTPLHLAAFSGRETAAACIQSLLARGADPVRVDRKRRMPAHYAALRGDAAALKLLLNAGPAAYMALDEAGHTPMHICVEVLENGAPLVKLPIAGYRLDVVNGRGEPVPHAAIRVLADHIKAGRSGKVEAAAAVLRTVAALPGACKIADKDGRRPLHYAVLQSSMESLSLLLEQASTRDLNLGDHQGMKPLHLACARGNFEMAKLLLNRDADPNARAASNITPLHIARERRDAHIIDLLTAAGASYGMAEI